MTPSDVVAYVDELGRNARTAFRSIASVSTKVKDDALLCLAEGLASSVARLEGANEKDLAAARAAKLSSAAIRSERFP